MMMKVMMMLLMTRPPEKGDKKNAHLKAVANLLLQNSRWRIEAALKSPAKNIPINIFDILNVTRR